MTEGAIDRRSIPVMESLIEKYRARNIPVIHKTMIGRRRGGAECIREDENEI